MKKVLTYIISICFVCIALISIVDFCCFERNFYSKEYEKSSTAEAIGVSDADLNTLTDIVLGYLKGNVETMDIELPVNGEVKEVFSERAKLHMVDVKQLYDNALLFGSITFVLLIVSIVILIVRKEFVLSDIYLPYKRTLICFGIVFGCILFYALIDFNSFWTNFHHMFFNNDLWLLSYNDVLVNMVNETFFFDLVKKIVLIFLGIIFGVFFILRISSNENKRSSI